MNLSSFLHTVKGFQVLLYVTVTIQHQSFASAQFVLFDPSIGPYQMLPLWGKVNLGAMAVKRYSTFPKSSRVKPRHHMV